jgi:spermidine synthase
MQPSRLQKLWSHFKDVSIENISSDFNEILQVVLSRGRYQLLTKNAIYSFGDLYSNYRKAFDAINIEQQKIDNVLILGFGLGSIPFMLENKYLQNYHYTAVEIDESVLYLANKYVTQHLKSPIEMLQADAFVYVMQSKQQFDLVCMDVFLDDKIPNQFETIDFLEGLKNQIAPNGILLLNRLYLTKTDKASTDAFFKNQFLKTFPEGNFLDVDGNWILTNRKI